VGTGKNRKNKRFIVKVLYIGNYKDQTGWGDASLNNILAMDKAGVDVVPRAITYNNRSGFDNDRILQLEEKSADGCDVCVQHVLPHLYNYDSNFKLNVGFLESETLDLKYSGWNNYASIMDEIWVPSNACKKSLDIENPVHIIPHCLDFSKYQDTQSGNKIENLIGTYNFVFIGEFIERKNLKALIRAFHTEFKPWENVNLYIKTSGADLPVVQNFCNQIKRGLKVSEDYKEEVVICGKLDKQDYISTLAQCHCFVMPSYGEAFCIPALEASAIGLECLWTEGIGVEDFATGGAVESCEEPCFGGTASLRNLYTAKNKWLTVNIEKLQEAMRKRFNDYKNGNRVDTGTKWERCSHENVGKMIRERLEQGVKNASNR
jgi:glycosyltransferase involved in cell wall biosynthesis